MPAPHDAGRPRRALSLLATLLLTIPLACDEASPPPRPVVTAGVSLQSLLYLRANCRTLLAPGASGVVYVAQVLDDAPQRVLALDNASTPRDTPLTTARLAEAMGVPGERPALRAMVALPNGDLLLYVRGVTRTRSLASLWIYRPGRDQLDLVADDRALGSASGMGASVDLADAVLVRAGQSIWLALRHVDATRCLRLDARELTTTGTARLARPFPELRSGDAARETPLNLRPDDTLYGREDGSLWLLRRSTGGSWQVGPDGRLIESDLPAAASEHPPESVPPLALPQGQWLYFYPDSERPTDLLAAPVIEVRKPLRYPLFQVVEQETKTVIDRDATSLRPGFPLHALRLTAWCIEPNSGAILAYDEMSGEVLRVWISGV